MTIIRPQLDQVRIGQDGKLPFAVIDAIRKVYDYLAASASTASGNIQIIQDTHANRLMLHPPADSPIGSLYYETDRKVVYINQNVSSAPAWVYVTGVMSGLFAARPADLGTNDAGFLFTSTNSLDYRWSGTAWVTLGTVRGGASLTNVGRLTKVSAAGTINESSVTDNGASITNLRTISGATQPNYVLDSGITAKSRLTRVVNTARTDILVNMSYDGTNWNLDDTGQIGTLLSILTTGIEVYFAPAGANPVTPVLTASFDNAGNINCIGVYKVGGVPGESVTLTYGTALGGVIPVGLTLSTKTVTFTGGIEIGHT